jgi:hypothetical protein
MHMHFSLNVNASTLAHANRGLAARARKGPF